MGGLFERTELIFGRDGMEKLLSASVLVVGLGGVGGFVCEALVRGGIGSIAVCDFDKITESNTNRQIIALNSTIGKSKAVVMAERLRDINPDCKVTVFDEYFDERSSARILAKKYDFIADCIDIVTSKLHLIESAHGLNIPIISACGTGNKTDPTRFEIADINHTSVCPLARVLRRELKARGIEHTEVLYSREPVLKIEQEQNARIVASNSFTPSIAGLLIARHIILQLV